MKKNAQKISSELKIVEELSKSLKDLCYSEDSLISISKMTLDAIEGIERPEDQQEK